MPFLSPGRRSGVQSILQYWFGTPVGFVFELHGAGIASNGTMTMLFPGFGQADDLPGGVNEPT